MQENSEQLLEQAGAFLYLAQKGLLKDPEQIESSIILFSEFSPELENDFLTNLRHSSIQNGLFFVILDFIIKHSTFPADQIIQNFSHNLTLRQITQQKDLGFFSNEILRDKFFYFVEKEIAQNESQISSFRYSEFYKNAVNAKNSLQSSGTPQSAMATLSLQSALQSYEKLSKQIVTKNNIVSKPFLKPLSPTVGNWISVYEKVVGAGKRTAIERGEFLYRSQACRSLPEVDRMKLAQLLKSHDEDTPLKINTDLGGIVWERKSDALPPQPTKAQPKNNAVSGSTPKSGIPQRPQLKKKLKDTPQIAKPHRKPLGSAQEKIIHKTTKKPTVEPTQKQTAFAPPLQDGTASLSHFAHQPQKAPQKNPSVQPKMKDDANVNFSSGQTLPIEKARSEAKPKRDPFSIKPMGR